MSDVKLPILAADPDKIPERMVVVGDPGRVEVVAGFFDDPEAISSNREYQIVTGTFAGVPVGVASHGVGSAGAAVCFEELCRAGVKRIIRAGSAGGMQPHINTGMIVLATGAVRDDGLSERIVPLGYPALASVDVVTDLRHAAGLLGVAYEEGLILTSDLFYPHPMLGNPLEMWQQAGVVAVEMECSTLFVIAGLHGVQAGAVVAIDGNPLQQDGGDMDTYDPHQDSVRAAAESTAAVALRAAVAGA